MKKNAFFSLDGSKPLLSKLFLIAVLLFFVLLFFSHSLSATQITPDSYVATPGQGQADGGDYNYFDDTGTQLIDDLLGADAWNANLGNEIAYEWVSWNTFLKPKIVFSFSEQVVINSVEIGFNHNSSSGGLYLPQEVKINNSSFFLSGNEIANGTRGFVTFNGVFEGSQITVEMMKDASGWLFIDEIRFFSVESSTTVPDSGASYLHLALGFCALIGLKAANRKNAVKCLFCGAFLSAPFSSGISFQDEFNSTHIDPTKWQASEPFGDSSVSESGGVAKLQNAGHLVSVDSFTGPYEVAGRFRFTGNIRDVFILTIRTTGDPYPSWHELYTAISLRIQKLNDPGNDQNNVIVTRQRLRRTQLRGFDRPVRNESIL